VVDTRQRRCIELGRRRRVARAPWEERTALWSPTGRVPEGLERVVQQCICGKECGIGVGTLSI
jgi:hypothetical protein